MNLFFVPNSRGHISWLKRDACLMTALLRIDNMEEILSKGEFNAKSIEMGHDPVGKFTDGCCRCSCRFFTKRQQAVNKTCQIEARAVSIPVDSA